MTCSRNAAFDYSDENPSHEENSSAPPPAAKQFCFPHFQLSTINSSLETDNPSSDVSSEGQ